MEKEHEESSSHNTDGHAHGAARQEASKKGSGTAKGVVQIIAHKHIPGLRLMRPERLYVRRLIQEIAREQALRWYKFSNFSATRRRGIRDMEPDFKKPLSRILRWPTPCYGRWPNKKGGKGARRTLPEPHMQPCAYRQGAVNP
jgi:hypothetical protein